MPKGKLGETVRKGKEQLAHHRLLCLDTHQPQTRVLELLISFVNEFNVIQIPLNKSCPICTEFH